MTSPSVGKILKNFRIYETAIRFFIQFQFQFIVLPVFDL